MTGGRASTGRPRAFGHRYKESDIALEKKTTFLHRALSPEIKALLFALQGRRFPREGEAQPREVLPRRFHPRASPGLFLQTGFSSRLKCLIHLLLHFQREFLSTCGSFLCSQDAGVLYLHRRRMSRGRELCESARASLPFARR